MKKFLPFFALLFLILNSINLIAQGTIAGSVKDASSNENLIGANVFIPGTAYGAATNIQGKFVISKIPTGKYNLKISYVGYKSRELQIEIFDNKTLDLKILLDPDVMQGNEVVVLGQALGQNAAINQQRTSNTIVNVLSEERIQELPDANAAEAIGRLPGVSILRSGGEANQIVLRGMSDKFTSINVDGIRIAPTDADARSIDLSTISQGSLAGIELFKALTPDKDGDAIAGTINLVTKKAPEARLLRLDSKGAYNKLDNTFSQYDFSLRYGERFFDDLLGVQLTGNLERRNRSNERINLDYNTNLDGKGTDYEITNFDVNYINEIRKRGGFGVLLDINTPDNGSVKINNIFNSTGRNFISYARNYTTGSGDLLYSARDREQEISTFNSSIKGDNNIFDFNLNWGFSFAQSKAEYPYDYYMEFTEPSILDNNGKQISGMGNVPGEYRKGPAENIIPYALNNFSKAYLNWAYYRGENNLDREKTAFLDITKKYVIGDLFTGEIKAGGKYRYKNRNKNSSELASNYLLGSFQNSVRLPDGTIVPKNFAGTRFENLQLDVNKVLFINFLNLPNDRNLFGKYLLNPLITRDALRDWYELNKNGISADGKTIEYARNNEIDADFYDITERTGAAYLMNTLNFGQLATLIAGVRIENESNDYFAKFSPSPLTGYPTPSGLLKDTMAYHKETIVLPNVQLTIRPLDFLIFRLAGYKAIARPDFNLRLWKYVARNSGGVTLDLGNPNLLSAEAWNFEVNGSVYHNYVGLFSVSAFYKEIKNMFHVANDIRTIGTDSLLQKLNFEYKLPWGNNIAFDLTYPYNSSYPTKVWGLEIEHQANLLFLPGLLKNIVLNYNFSLIRSETYITATRIDTSYIVIGTIKFPKYTNVVYEKKNKLEGQPEFFGNFAIGYDIGGFSARISLFYQGEFTRLYSASGRSDLIQGSFTRWDLALKYEVSKHLSLFLNINNITDVEESRYINNNLLNKTLLDNSEKYGMTGDLGVRFTL